MSGYLSVLSFIFYSPLMIRMYEDGGELALILASVKMLGLTVTLDMAMTDPVSDAGRADATSGLTHWKAVTERVADGWKHREVKLQLEGWSPK